MRYLTVFFVLMLILPIGLASDDYLFEGWVVMGDSFEFDDYTYLTSQGETASSAIIMGPTGIYVLDEGDCITVNKLKFCAEEFKYTKGGNITIHGSDTQEFYITISEPGADLSINLDAEPSDILVGETARITIMIENDGEEGASALYFEEIVPPEFEITNTFGLERMGNKLTWRGGLAAGSFKELSYDIKAKKRFADKLVGELTYKSGEITKKISDSLGFKATGVFNINFNADDFEIDAGEETRVYITLTNNKDEEAAFTITTVIPSGLEVVASHFNDTSGNTLRWEGDIDSEDEIKLTVAVKGLTPGKAVITATGSEKNSILGADTKEFEMTVKEIKPEVSFIYSNLKEGEEGVIKLYLKNPSAFMDMTDITARLESDYFSEEGTAPKFRANEYNAVVSATFTPDVARFKARAVVTYTFQGQEKNILEEKMIDVQVDEMPEEQPIEEVPEQREPTAEEKKAVARAEKVNGFVEWFRKVEVLVYFWK
ncbi:MAG: hypothetical protein KKE20_02350 [Nanoarchaeota archaeon]|nr:hypothetical protein [Nanoarchaeota archaeon]